MVQGDYGGRRTRRQGDHVISRLPQQVREEVDHRDANGRSLEHLPTSNPEPEGDYP